MATVSRRLFFVKMKSRLARSKLKTEVTVRPDEQLIGEAAHPSASLLSRSPEKPPARRQPYWRVILIGFGGLATLTGTVAFMLHLDGHQRQPEELVSVARNAASYSGYGGSSTGRQAGTTIGSGNVDPSQSSTEAFLAAPFPKRKTGQVTCSVQVVHSDAAMNDFNKCLQQADE
jgi:hypothetical protein